MRVLRKSGRYLKNQALKNLGLAIFCMIIFGVNVWLVVLKLLAFQIDLLRVMQLLICLLALAGFYVFWRRYRIFRGGLEGEQQVVKLLKAKLSNDYYLINDAYFRDGYGDIDHIILGPNGLFVIETKNWSGKISCQGDEWQRDMDHRISNSLSPSKQVKKNASRVRNAVESGKTREKTRISVEGIIVFTNRHADLHITHPSVPVLRLWELPKFVTSFKDSGSYTRQQLEQIGKKILEHIQ
jgi:hypothetical protein